MYEGLKSIRQDDGRFYYFYFIILHVCCTVYSPSLSDSPGALKVYCNVTGDFMENTPIFKSLKNSSDFFSFNFFYQH